VWSRVAADGYARMTGRTGDDAFGKAENAAHLRLAIKGGDEVHFRRAGIGETDVDAVGKQRIDEHIRARGANWLAAFSHAPVPRLALGRMIAAPRPGASAVHRPREVKSCARRRGAAALGPLQGEMGAKADQHRAAGAL